MANEQDSVGASPHVEAESRAKREAAAARIRAGLAETKEAMAARLNAHLEDHGEEHETSAEEFLRETDPDKPGG